MDKIYVISGTHWDREWRFTAEQSKVRLMKLIDNIMDILETKPSWKAFMLDGGTIIAEDYLTVRPESKDRFTKLVKEGRLLLVPWYTLPDMFLVASESIVRNLLMGRKVGREHGGVMKNAYTATSYGQPSQMPQIISGFGMKAMLFYRGLNSAAFPPVFRWRGPDGSEILVIKGFDEFTRTNFFFTAYYIAFLGKKPGDLRYRYNRWELPIHLADSEGYEFDFQVMREDSTLPEDENRYIEGVKALYELCDKYRVGNHLLALNVEDNQKPFYYLPEFIEKLNEATRKAGIDAKLFQATFDEYVEDILNETDWGQLQQLEGEMRATKVTPGFGGLLGAVLSSRVNLKLLNDEVERKLILQAEPLAVFASWLGWEYPKRNLERAWKSLLANHAHDSICGAAVDQAHKDMLYRFSEARMVAEEVSRRALEHIWFNINTAGLGLSDKDLTLTFFNILPWKRSEVVWVNLDVPVELFPDGEVFFDILDESGGEVKYEILSKRKITMRAERELDTAVHFDVWRFQILLPVELEGFSYRTFCVKFRGRRFAVKPAPVERKLIAAPGGILENEFLRVEINKNGTFNVVDKETGKVYENLHYFVDTGEVGSAHITAQPRLNFDVTSLGTEAQVELVESTELRGTYRVSLTMKVPAAATLDGDARLKDWTVEIPTKYEITLTKGSRRLEIKLYLNNKARDHRLSVMFPTGADSYCAKAESVFCIEERDHRWLDVKDNLEPHFPYAPMKSFVDVSDRKGGMAFLSRGLREYRLYDDPQRTLAVTLLRTQRAYMTANQNMDWYELEKYTGAHVLQELNYEYALLFHGPDYDEFDILREAYSFGVPIRVVQGPFNDAGAFPVSGSFLKVSGKVAFSGAKLSEDGKGWIFRFWNPYKKKIKFELSSGVVKIVSVEPATLDEERVDEQVKVDFNASRGVAEVEAGPAKIITLRIGVEK